MPKISNTVGVVLIENGNFAGKYLYYEKQIGQTFIPISRFGIGLLSCFILGDKIEINAQYFNKNFEFDEKARLSITIENSQTKVAKNYDLLKGSNSYKVNLDGLPAGKYNFKITELNSNERYLNHFEILDFNIEKQFVNPDFDKLNQLAIHTNGKVYLPNQVDELIEQLLNNEEFKAVQKNTITKSPLIDWVGLLVVIAFLLSIEWFVRKYNGLL